MSANPIEPPKRSTKQLNPDSAPNSVAQLTQCHSPIGHVQLKRYTPDPTGTLRAWDAADQFLFSLLAEQHQPLRASTVLIINDEFGAITTMLAKAGTERLHSVNDSFIGRRATRENLAANGLVAPSCAPTSDASIPAAAAEANLAGLTLYSDLPKPIAYADLILIKIPKSTALLVDQLHRVRAHMGPQTRLYAAAMARHLTANTRETFENIIGPTDSSRAVKKARILTPAPNISMTPPDNPYPGHLNVPDLPQALIQHSAIFSQKKLDGGTALLLAHLPPIAPNSHVIDLGCGTGVLGLVAMQRERTAKLRFVDESSAAIHSTQVNCAALFPARQVICSNQDCLEPAPDESADLILCNPPFHTHRNLVSVTAERMFSQSLHALRQGGVLYIVGNRHLGYTHRLQRIFGNHRLVAQNPRFQVISATRR